MEDNYKVGIYLRLSREDERLGESGSISNQRDLLLNYIRDNNLMFVDEYVDDGVSGTTFDREGFNRMIKDCENKRINMIITKDTSRLGRDHIEFGFYVERYFPEHNIRYVAVNDGIDTSISSSANDMLVFKSAFNDMYVKDISNKLKASLNTKKRNGKFVGAYAPYGYEKDVNDKHKLIIKNDESKIVRRIYDMYISGLSIEKICEKLTIERVPTPSESKNMNIGWNNFHKGVWATRTVYDMLQNPTYIGNLAQCKLKKVSYKSKKVVRNKKNNWIICEGAIDPIIDKDTFEIVQNLIKTTKNRISDGLTDKLLLRGFIYCKECGHTIGFRAQSQNTKKNGLVTRIYGNCNYWAKRKRQNVCTPHSIKYEKLEKVILDDIRKTCKEYLNENNLVNLLKNNDRLKKKKDSIKSEIFRIDKEIDNTNKKIDISYNDKLEGNITLDMYKRTYNNLIIKINESKNKKIELEKLLFDLEDNDEKNESYYLDKIKRFLEMKNPSRALISSLIDKIEIDEEKNIDIYYKFKIL